MAEQASLHGKTAVVTGGSRGIGRQIATALADAGATVIVTARSTEKLAETVDIIRDAGGDCHAYTMDVSNPQEIASVMATIFSDFGTVDILINNAGVANGGQLPWEITVTDWWHVMEVNVLGVFACCHAVLPHMIEKQSGCIINVGSYAGLWPAPDASAYSVSKAALMRVTDNLAAATEAHGVAVFVISPGLVLTDMTRDVPVFKDVPPDQWTPIERAGELCVALATGKANVLSGRFIHASDDDLDDLIAAADTIKENDLHMLTMNRKTSE